MAPGKPSTFRRRIRQVPPRPPQPRVDWDSLPDERESLFRSSDRSDVSSETLRLFEYKLIQLHSTKKAPHFHAIVCKTDERSTRRCGDGTTDCAVRALRGSPRPTLLPRAASPRRGPAAPHVASTGDLAVYRPRNGVFFRTYLRFSYTRHETSPTRAADDPTLTWDSGAHAGHPTARAHDARSGRSRLSTHNRNVIVRT